MHFGKIQTFCALLFTAFSSATFANTVEDDITKRLESLVSKERAGSGLVSLAATISQPNAISAIAVSGERQIDSQIQLSKQDKWHLGSVTKSITATMIARLVEKSVLQWSSTIGDVLTDDRINNAWRDVTLHMLLTHTAGAKTDFPWRIQSLHPQEGELRQSLRKEEVLKILEDEPEYKPGTEFEYSNVGYTIAGVMAATKTGKSWENLIREEVFQPLQLSSGGFGPPIDENNALGQPRGHKDTWFSGPEAVTAETDNSPIMGPAGSIHLSLQDLTTYANEHLLGSQGHSQFLSQATFNRLHKMGAHDYAYGWIAARKTEWANHQPVLYHSGTNRFWYALLVMLPESQLSIAVTTNDGNLKAAQKSAWNIARQMGAYVLEINSL